MRIYHEIDGVQYIHRRTEKPFKMDFHLHDRFEVYFFISGDVQYLIEKKVYPLGYGDVLLMNSRELHKPTYRSETPYENIVIHFDPQAVERFTAGCQHQFNLLNCFTERPLGEQNKIHLAPHELEELLSLYAKMDGLFSRPDDGSELLMMTYFIQLLVLINRAFSHNLSPLPSSLVPEKLAPVLDFIDHHLDHDLTLEALEQQFFMNRYYLSRLFKQSIGSTIHEYILLKRIAYAKKLLHEGCNVTDACQQSGFNDYSNFIRMFKRIVGVPPGKYRTQHI